VKNKDNESIAQAYVQGVLLEVMTPETWVKGLAGQQQLLKLLQQPVSFSTVTQTGGKSYGQVTLKQIIDQAKTLLGATNNNPQMKQSTLTRIANNLQDYIAGLNQDSSVPQNLKLDNQTTDSLMDTFANLGEVEKFITAFGNTGTSTTVPAPKPINHTPEKDIHNEPYARTPQEANIKIRTALSDYLNRVESPEDKQKIMKWLQQPTPYKVYGDNWPVDPELQGLLRMANISTDSTRHLMTPQQKQEVDRKEKLRQEYNKVMGVWPNRNMTAGDMEKALAGVKR